MNILRFERLNALMHRGNISCRSIIDNVQTCALGAPDAQYPTIEEACQVLPAPIQAYGGKSPPSCTCSVCTMLSPVALFLLFALVCRGIVVNYTIDDTNGADAGYYIMPEYYPPENVWNWGPHCTTCAFQPPALDQVYGRTWHEANYIPGSSEERSISFTFNGALRILRCFCELASHTYVLLGSAIYVFFIMGPYSYPNGWNITDTHLTITLDGKFSNIFHYLPEQVQSGYEYNHLVYHNSSLRPGQHRLKISCMDDKSSILAFDYAQYRFVYYHSKILLNSRTCYIRSVEESETSSTISSSSSSDLPVTPSTPTPPTSPLPSNLPRHGSIGAITEAIIGGVTGGLVVIGVLALFYYRRRRHDERITNILHDDGSDWTPPAQRYRSWIQTPAESHRTLTPVMSESEQNLLVQGHVFPFPMINSPGITTPTSNLASKSEAEIRQTELRRRIREVQIELAELERGLSSSHNYDEPNIDDLRRNMEHMRIEIERLKEALHSKWGRGLTDELPPVYAEVGPSRLQ